MILFYNFGIKDYREIVRVRVPRKSTKEFANEKSTNALELKKIFVQENSQTY